MTEPRNELMELCTWIRDRHGYDFFQYQERPLRRSMETMLRRHGHQNVADLLKSLAADPGRFSQVLAALTVSTSTMFRDPHIFRHLVDDLFPRLRTYPSFKIWHAGCARGEEVFSLAILLKEHGLLSRARIYATDISPAALHDAREGIYPTRRLKEFAANYEAAGGTKSVLDYFEVQYGFAKLRSEISERVLFSKHDLTSDDSFGEMQLILCRNVLIYFNADLQARVFDVFRRSLSPKAYLILGRSEPMPGAGWLSIVNKRAMIFQEGISG